MDYKHIVFISGVLIAAALGLGYHVVETRSGQDLAFDTASSWNYLSANIIAGQDTWACDDSLYLMAGSSIYELDDSGSPVVANLISTDGVNSLAMNINDGYMYGVQAKTVVRISTTAREDVGPVEMEAGVYSGTFLADGTYLVNGGADSTGDFPLYHIDISGPSLIKTVYMDASFADIARSPIDGELYGFSSNQKKIAKIQPHTGDIEYIGDAQTSIHMAGAAFFRADGVLYLYGRQVSGGQQDTLFQADVTTGEVEVVQTVIAVGGSDGSSCVGGVDAVDPEAPPQAPEIPLVTQRTDHQAAPKVPIVSVCQPPAREGDGWMCVRRFPAKVAGKPDQTVDDYEACIAGDNDPEFCIERWVSANGLKRCEGETDCGESVVSEDIEVPEVNLEGCVEYEGDAYCVHRQNGAGVNTTDGRTLYQSDTQNTLLVKECVAASKGASTYGGLSRKERVCGFKKLGAYVGPSELAEGTQTQVPTETVEVLPSVGVCQPGRGFIGQQIIAPTGKCQMVAPSKGAKYSDGYHACLERTGGDRQECVEYWGELLGEICTVSSDCG